VTGADSATDADPAGRVLVAGVGNVFLSDDGFGMAVIEQLQRDGGLPAGVELVDTGIRGMHLAYQLLDGYRALVIVDAVQRGSAPGTLYTLEHDLDAPRSRATDAALDGHGMDPDAVLALLDGLAGSLGLPRPVDRVFVVGCEPAVLAEGIGLSPPVAAAVEPAALAVTALVTVLMIDEGAPR
jgi:hydrogenase maturation protease